MSPRLLLKLLKHPARRPRPLPTGFQAARPPSVKLLGGGLDALIFRGRDYPHSAADRLVRYTRAAMETQFLPNLIHRCGKGLRAMDDLRCVWRMKDTLVAADLVIRHVRLVRLP